MYHKELIHVDCSTKPLRSELLVGSEQSLASGFRVTLVAMSLFANVLIAKMRTWPIPREKAENCLKLKQ